MDRLTEPIVIAFYPLFSSRISCEETSGSPAMGCVVRLHSGLHKLCDARQRPASYCTHACLPGLSEYPSHFIKTGTRLIQVFRGKLVTKDFPEVLPVRLFSVLTNDNPWRIARYLC